MAKKARRKAEGEDEASQFEFPEFDERKFLRHEYEQTTATGFAFLLAVLIGALSWAIDRVLTSVDFLWVPWVLGIGLVAFSPYLMGRLRPLAAEYTRGDWASLILIELFGWLGVWFLLLNVLPP